MNMHIELFIKALSLGFLMAAPVGPIAILCIRRTLAHGFLAGLVSGFGAATADAFYCLIAALGLTFVSTFLIEQQFYVTLLGTCFLVYLGIKTYRTPPAQTAAHIHGRGWFGAYFSTLALTLSNPMTLFAFTALFASFGIAELESNVTNTLLIVTGVFLGSSLWWFILTNLVSLFRSKINAYTLGMINKVSGIIIVVFALVILISLRHRIIILPS